MKEAWRRVLIILILTSWFPSPSRWRFYTWLSLSVTTPCRRTCKKQSKWGFRGSAVRLLILFIGFHSHRGEGGLVNFRAKTTKNQDPSPAFISRFARRKLVEWLTFFMFHLQDKADSSIRGKSTSRILPKIWVLGPVGLAWPGNGKHVFQWGLWGLPPFLAPR